MRSSGATAPLRYLCAEMGEFVETRVEDDGPGIDAHLKDSVLKEGMRLDTAVPGTGVGSVDCK